MNYKWRCVLQWVITSYHMISWIGLDWIGLQLDAFGLLVAFFWWGKLAVLFWTRNQLVHDQYPNGKATDQSFKRFGNSKCTNWRRHVQSQTFGNLHHFFLLAKLSQVWKKKKNFWNIGQLISSRRHSSRNYWIGITPRHYRVILITQNVTQSLSFKSACDWLEMACHVKNTLG